MVPVVYTLNISQRMTKKIERKYRMKNMARTRKHSSRMRIAHFCGSLVGLGGGYGLGEGESGPRGGGGYGPGGSGPEGGMVPRDMVLDGLWHYPSPHEQTNTCENIIFPQLHLRAV